MTIRVLRPGLLTTLQDGGRYGLALSGLKEKGLLAATALEV